MDFNGKTVFITGGSRGIGLAIVKKLASKGANIRLSELEEFLIENWENTELSKNYDIYQDEEVFGEQFQTDTGPIDILAISKDKKTLLVVELKKGRVSDNVVGQIQRYMGFVKDDLAEKNQDVKGVIIGHDDDIRIQRALSVTNNIDFFKYQVNFKLYQ